MHENMVYKSSVLCIVFFTRTHGCSGERDEYMANAIVSSDSRKLVGVVGLGHLAGIEQYLTASGLKSVLRDCTLMPPSNVK